MPDETASGPAVSAEEVELLWVLCYSIVQGEIRVHPDYLPIATALEPKLYAMLQRMAPGFESMHKMKFKH